jgi:hypothetical protein
LQALARVVASLRDLKAPPAAAGSVLGVLRYALEAAVRQLAGHLEQLPAALAAREAWVVSLTQPVGEAPITHLPEALQEEITVAITYYKGLTSTAEEACPDGGEGEGSSSGGGGGDGRLPSDITTRPLHVAFFACLGQCTTCLAALAERYSLAAGDSSESPGATAARRPGGGESSGVPGTSGSGGSGGTGLSPARGGGAARSAVLAMGPDSDDDDEAGLSGGLGAGPGGPSGGPGARRGVGVGGVPGVSDDVRLLLTASNLSYIRNRLMASLTQRFLLVLTGRGAAVGVQGCGPPILNSPIPYRPILVCRMAWTAEVHPCPIVLMHVIPHTTLLLVPLASGEVASEVDRVGRTVKGLAKRMDAALASMFDTFLDRKRRALDRLVAAYVRDDGAPAGVPPELRDVTPGVQGLLQALAQVQAEVYTYARWVAEGRKGGC